MKIALVLAGHLRTFYSNFSFFKENILNNINTDVYISTWDTYGTWTPDIEIGLNETQKVEQGKLENLLKNYNHFINIENHEDFRPEFKKRSEKFEPIKVIYNPQPGGSPRPINVISMWHKRYNAIKMVNDSKINYNKIILIRPDIRLYNQLNYFNMSMEISNLYNDVQRGYADIFFNGSLEQINRLVDVYNNMEQMIEDHQQFCGHTLIKWWLNKKKIPFEIKNYNMELYNTENGYCKI